MQRILKYNETGYGILIEHDAGSLNVGNSEEFKTIIESINLDPGKPLFIDCILQKANHKNKNGRIYPRPTLEREINNYQQLIKEGRALSECNHPDNSNIDLNNVSHRVIKTWWEGDTVYGTLEIITSPGFKQSGIISAAGDRIANFLRLGVKLGISSRGIGSLREIKGENIVQPDFELVGFDIVANPSTPGAFLFNKEDKKIGESEIKVIKPQSNDLDSILDRFLEQ